jgi:acetoin utilization protein AcuC
MRPPKDAVLFHKGLENYSFGEGHPFKGDRFAEFFKFFNLRAAPFRGDFEIISPKAATDEQLELVHTAEYIQAIRSASGGKPLSDVYQYVSADNLNPITGSIPPGIEEASRIIVGTSVLAGELVAEGKVARAIGIGGGMHHARPGFGEGFFFYNDVAVCVRHLKKKYGLKRFLVLDTDAHAGNGTAEIFYSDPEVLFIDIHQDGRTVYPGTGYVHEIGSGKGEGFTVNLPLLPGAGNRAYEFIFDAVIFPLAREFQPQIIIRYGGSDPHYLDELTDLGLTLSGFRILTEKVRLLAQELTGGRSVDLMLSGYNIRVLPFAWMNLLCGVTGMEADLSGFREDRPPAPDARLKETKDTVRELKKNLKKYWRALEDRIL